MWRTTSTIHVLLRHLQRQYPRQTDLTKSSHQQLKQEKHVGQ